MKKIFPFLLILTAICCSCSGNKQNISVSVEEPNIPKYTVQIELDCIENLLFSKYDLDIYVDDTNIGKLDHGANRTYNVDLGEGMHTLTITKRGDKNIDGSVDFTISENSEFKYKLSCTRNQVKVEEILQNEASDIENTQTHTEEERKEGTSTRNISGFDFATNQTIVFCGLNFSFPEYYNVCDEASTNTYRHYYPAEEDYYSSLRFSAEDTEFSQADFDDAKSAIAENILEQLQQNGASEFSSESIMISDISGWSISYIVANDTISTENFAFLFNPNNKKIITISQGYGSNDKSNYDYTGDYKRIIESVALSEDIEKESDALQKKEDDLQQLITLDKEKNKEEIKNFADTYKGEEIQLELITAFVEQYKNYKTRFNYLLYAVGDESVMLSGPAFMFKDVSYYDLHLTGDNKPSVFGLSVHCVVTAKVDGYENEMILLKPISIKVIKEY